MTRSAGSTSGLDWGSLMTTTSPNARGAGFDLAVAHDLYVHHFGSRTFAGNGINAEKLLDENAGRFPAKWGLAQNNGRRVALRPWKGPPESEEISRKAAKTAKNENGFAFGPGGDLRAALVASDPFPSSSLAPLRLDMRSSFLDNTPSLDLGERATVSLTMIVEGAAPPMRLPDYRPTFRA
jgi:hypothetical protein